MTIAAATPEPDPFDEAARALAYVSRNVRLAMPSERLHALRDAAEGLRAAVAENYLSAAEVVDKIYEVARANHLLGEPGSEDEATIAAIARLATAPPDDIEIGREGPPPAADNICELCTRPIDQHRRVETPQGPEFFCDEEIDRQKAAEAAAMLLCEEAIDPRDPAIRAADELWQNEGRPEDERLDQHQAAQPPALALISPSAWRDVPLPDMRWLATNRIPAGDVTILSGDGGGGKTTVALQLAVAVEQDLGDWLGTTCEAGPVIFFSGEEPENEMRRRLKRVARQRGIEPADILGMHFHFADPDRCMLGISRPTGAMVPTELFESFAAAALAIRPALIVVDSIAAVFGGNQNDRVHARTFVGMFRRLARVADCAILLLDHPSLSGITSGTGRGGSMDWQNATRARLHLETVEGEDGGTGRVLEVKKLNYGPIGEKVKLRWEDGCFLPEGGTPAPARANAEQAADRAYLDCLDAATGQRRNVFAPTGRNHAPSVFADMPEAKGASARALKAAQERLFAAGIIWNEPFGPPSRGSSRIARKPAVAAQ
jgi:RecA-family ATPase